MNGVDGDMKLIIFGTGVLYQKYKNRIPKKYEIIAFLDNRQDIQGTELDGVRIYPPEQIHELEYDRIVLMSVKGYEMKEQLLQLGVAEEKIDYWNDFYGREYSDEICYYSNQEQRTSGRRHVLVITEDLGFHGAAMAIIYAICTLSQKGYDVVLMAPHGDDSFIEEMVNKGISIVVMPKLLNISEIEIRKDDRWRRFDAAVVNVFPMMRCACEFSKVMPTLWWIHEARVGTHIYERFIHEQSQYANVEQFKHINICAVSTIAQNNFNHYFPNVITETLPYGIPDHREISSDLQNNKLVFAIIGGVCELKNQRDFVEAVKRLNENYRDRFEAWIIGKCSMDGYTQRIKKECETLKNVKIWGELNRDELGKIYPQIDAVVCPSLEDSLPIVMTEGMMYGKVCIASERTGTKDLITNGVNGFVCQIDDKAEDLTEKMEYVLTHREEMQKIGQNARNTYEQYFTMEAFGERLEQKLEETIERY